MRKSIKYSASLIVIILSIITSFVAYAEETTTTDTKPIACTMDAKSCPDGSFVGRVGPKCEFAQCPSSINNLNRKNEINTVRNELQAKKDAYNNKMKQLVEQTKIKREEFKKELDLKKEESKNKIEEIKTTLKEKFAKIKDEKKKVSAEKIVGSINDLNVKRTNELTDKLNQIDNVLLSVNSRISKVENKILDIATLSTKQSAVTDSIAAAKLAILTQASKKYTVVTIISDEAALKVEMKKLRDTFNSDIKAVNEKVKLAHVALRDLVTNISKIPNVNEDEISNKVETDTNTTNTN
jgi:DNA repair exonuclease SbcCD ATPase subunit